MSYYNKVDGVFWIKGLKVVCWCVFALINIIGISLGIIFDDAVGILITLACFAIAFISVASTMVFLSIAENISNIVRILNHKNGIDDTNENRSRFLEKSEGVAQSNSTVAISDNVVFNEEKHENSSVEANNFCYFCGESLPEENMKKCIYCNSVLD